MPSLEPPDLIALGVVATTTPACLWLWYRGRSSAALSLWIALIVAVSVPFFDLHAHTHWPKVNWVPFWPPYKLADLIANVLLYLPFGGFWSRRKPDGHAPWAALGAAILLSTAVEGSQLFSHGRFPSATDISCNALGAALGLVLHRRFEHFVRQHLNPMWRKTPAPASTPAEERMDAGNPAQEDVQIG